MIEPKEITIDIEKFDEVTGQWMTVPKTYFISKFPTLAGREIVTQYVTTGMPKIGDYKANEALTLKLMKYVSIINEDGTNLPLVSEALINKYVDSWETCLKIEWAMLEYNCSFFRNGRASTFFAGIAQNAKQWITATLMDSLGQLFPKEKPPSTN